MKHDFTTTPADYDPFDPDGSTVYRCKNCGLCVQPRWNESFEDALKRVGKEECE